MNQHAREVLEFDKVIAELAEYALCEQTRTEIIADFVNGDRGFAVLVPKLTAFKDAVGLTRLFFTASDRSIPEFVPDMTGIFGLLSKTGMVLELEQLSQLYRFLSAGASIRHFMESALKDEHAAKTFPAGRELLSNLLASFSDTRNTVNFLRQYLDDQGALKEEQIPELRQARQRILQTQNELRKTAQHIVQAHAGQLSADLATVRDGRTVIPLKSDFKGRIPGIVHQSSGSGNTLFLEPMELVDLNNACTEAEHEYAAAVHRILRAISQKLSQDFPQLDTLYRGLLDFDAIFCRARYSFLHDCVPAQTAAAIALPGARHPLIGKKVVPIDIVYEEQKRLVVISGPNTGGKTVALKTLGLFALMNQAGMEIPAIQGATLPVFKDIFADIGDEQSIAANLSTFSAHLSRIAGILNEVDAQSLVLLDELGSGTDPEEGAALAMAVTEELIRRQSFTLITSHHGALKAMAFSAPGAVNASMEFSDAELRPTYRVIMGLPGSSHALDIAERMGLQAAVLKRSREFAAGKSTPLETLVADLTKKQESLRESQAEADALLRKTQEREKALDSKLADIAARELDLRRKQNADAGTFLQGARSEIEAILRELSSYKIKNQGGTAESPAQTAEAETAKNARETLAALSARQKEESESIQESLRRSIAVSDLSPGTEVFVRGSSQQGVLERQAKNGRWDVLIQGKRLSLPAEQLEVRVDSLNSSKNKKDKTVKPQYTAMSGGEAVFSLDIRGMRANEAVDALIRQLDAAIVRGMEYFGVVHGKGEGILQKAIHDTLKQSPGVERFAFARPEDGGSGKTLVYLRR